ncbi:DUF4391 domain-containing protein [Macrococcoides caseolyticum]|uniref:DUF4391 domain-containing protein n=1 Tax=Macrococcoides caseolyticum TaxID=69966 RepID=UPI000C32B819|nr:DUF4391 domain-containing protein [Macrococcus caseolyticus]PKE16365.1 hypothetical protein CW718_10125 [Macrococcus caseolyticus]
MKEEEILTTLNLPKESWTLRTFPFNQLEKQLTLPQRKLFQERIVPRGIRILATISERNTNILKYESETEKYEEIILFQIKVNELSKVKDIYKTLASVMPYPLIIIFNCEDRYKIIMSEHEKTDNSYLRVTNMLETTETINLNTYLSSANLDALDKTSLKSLYLDMMAKFVAAESKEKYDASIEGNKVELLELVMKLDKEIQQLVNKAKKEPQLNRRIEYQLKANKLKEERAKYLTKEESQ